MPKVIDDAPPLPATAWGPLSGPLKWHGGKHYLASKIVGLMPPRCKAPNAPRPGDPGWLHYVEPFFGGGAVLLAQDPEGISEVANDVDGRLTNLWATLADEAAFARFFRAVEAAPFSKPLFKAAAQGLRGARGEGDPVLAARDFFVCCRQSLAGRMKGFSGITRNRARRGMNAEVSAWLSCIEGLPAVHRRLKRVLILNDDALTVISKEDGPRTLFYLDPPYLHETRATTGEYAHEMSGEDHAALLGLLGGIRGRFMLSGYRSGMYDEAAALYGWRRCDFDMPNNSAGGKDKRRMVECLWLNYAEDGRRLTAGEDS